MRLRGLVFIPVCAVVAACGSTAHRAADSTTTVHAQGARKCHGGLAARQAAQRSRLDRDLLRLRAAAATMKHDAQDGNAATNNALDRFMLDIGPESLSAKVRNRYIDRAAGIVSAHCYLCFQTLESNRPLAAGAKLPCD